MLHIMKQILHTDTTLTRKMISWVIFFMIFLVSIYLDPGDSKRWLWIGTEPSASSSRDCYTVLLAVGYIVGCEPWLPNTWLANPDFGSSGFCVSRNASWAHMARGNFHRFQWPLTVPLHNPTKQISASVCSGNIRVNTVLIWNHLSSACARQQRNLKVNTHEPNIYMCDF